MGGYRHQSGHPLAGCCKTRWGAHRGVGKELKILIYMGKLRFFTLFRLALHLLITFCNSLLRLMFGVLTFLPRGVFQQEGLAGAGVDLVGLAVDVLQLPAVPEDTR